MSTTNSNETQATTPATTTTQPKPVPGPDGRSELPAGNQDFPTPGSTGSDDSGSTTGA
jgi:hypothetical protein